MSREHELQYQLERQRREELARQRAAEFVEKSYRDISAEFKKMKDEEYDSYIPDEMAELARNIKQIEQNLNTDVFAARNLCYQAQRIANSMSFLVSAAKEEAARKERLRFIELQRQREEAKSKLMEFFYEKLSQIKNPQVSNFGVSDLEVVKSKIENEEFSSESEVVSQLEKVSEQATEKAAKWKAEKLAKEKVAILSSQIDFAIKSVQNEKFENEEKKNLLVAEMNSLKNSVTVDSSEKEITEKLRAIQNSVDDSLVDEEVRRETVKAIIKELRSQEFSVEKPQIFGEGKNSYVLVKAKKPSGKQAVCKINLEGKLNYRFDKYEGMTCLKDIEKFNEDLQKCYSIKLSVERVIWENPDRLSRTQSVSSDSNRRNM